MAGYFKNPLSLQIDYSKFDFVSEEEKTQVVKMRPSASFWKDGFKRLFKNPIAIICISVILLCVLLAIFVPIVWPYKYSEILAVSRYGQTEEWTSWLQASKDNSQACFNNLKPFEFSAFELHLKAQGKFIFPHILGTDSQGRDYFIRLIYGMRVSLIVGFFASIIVFFIGTIYGSIAGYFGGKVDLVMMRIVDVIYSLPDLLIIILLSAVLKVTLGPKIAGTFLEPIGVSMISIFIVYGVLYWVGMARMVRGQIISIKQQEFVLAAKSIGTSPAGIIFKHLLPNCVSIIIITTALQIPSAIFTESFLSFVGLGVALPMPSLGSLASDASDFGILKYWPYQLICSAGSICAIVLCLNLIGDSLRDAFDPKLRK